MVRSFLRPINHHGVTQYDAQACIDTAVVETGFGASIFPPLVLGQDSRAASTFFAVVPQGRVKIATFPQATAQNRAARRLQYLATKLTRLQK
jgi:hypothetical protein